MFRLATAQNVNILKNGVCGSLIPGILIMPLLGGQQVDIFPKLTPQISPTLLNMPD
jgi:hypothetical protein